MINFTGDLHGSWDMRKLKTKNTKNITSDDVLIIAGDFGVIWDTVKSKEEIYLLDILDRKKYPIFFVPGNHENWRRLLSDEFKIIPMYGSEVKQISNNVFMLIPGNVYEIEGKKILALGGAESIDKESRKENISWWPEEIPTQLDFYKAKESLALHNNKVDIVVSHATHKGFFELLQSQMPSLQEKRNDPTVLFLEEIKEMIQYDLWVCGHYHMNSFSNELRSVVLYNTILTYSSIKAIVNNNTDNFYLRKV